MTFRAYSHDSHCFPEIAKLGQQTETNEVVEAFLRRDLPNYVTILLVRR
jgi:hypothetical protein